MKTFGLVEMPGKTTDSRAKAFTKRHGRNVQVEVEALAPEDLRNLFQEEIDRWHDPDAFDVALAREAAERQELLS